MKKIVFFDTADYEIDWLRRTFEEKCDCEFIKESLNSLADLPAEILSAEVISCFTSSRIPNEVLEKFPNLRLIALRSVGFNHVDIEYCKEHGIYVENTPNYGNMSVAEFAFALLLDVVRKVTFAYNDLRNAVVDAHHTVGMELYNKTIGIVGLGGIGGEMARLCHGFGMNILGYDMVEKSELKEKYGVEYTDFETLVKESNIITLHAPLTKDNYHIFNAQTFSKMKPSTILINTARGELIETQALYNALIEKRIGGAGLDVLESEETLTNSDFLVDIGRMTPNVLQKTVLNNRLLNLENVIITPHIAYDTREAIARILSTTASNIFAFIEGRIQNNVY